MKTSNWLFWVQRRLASGYRPRSRRGAIPATTALESRLLLTTFYVDDNFAITNETGAAGLSTGDTVTFAPGEAGEVTGLTFGTNAFSSIAEAQVPAVAGDVIRVGTGTFAHSGQLNITKDITITGSGQDATILMRQGNNTGNDNRTIEVQTAGVTFEQLTLGGWQGTVSTGTGYHVWLNNADNATFDDVRFDASKPMRVAIYVGGSGNADNLTVADSLFSGTYYRATIRGGAEGMTITGNRFEELHYAGSDAISEAYSSIYMEYAGNVSGVISGNYFAAGVVNTIVPNVNNSVHTITNWRTVGAAGLTVSHNTFDLQDGDLLSDNGFVPVAFYSDPVLAQANPITVKDNIFRGYSYTGVQPTNAPQFRPGLGQFGGALEFDGVNDFGTFNFGSNELGDQGTISLWVKMDNTGRRNQILEGPGNGGGLELQYRNNSSGQFYATPSQPGGDFVIRSGGDSVGLAGTWTNIQVIYDFAGLPGAEGGGKLRIFRDGVESNYLAGFTPTDLTWTSVASTVNGIMNLGRDPGDSTRFFDGMMDDVAWYDSVLSAAERTAIRTSGVTADARLVAHWNMDNASGVTTVAGNSGTGVTLNLGGSLQGGAIVSSAGTVASYNLFQSNDVNFNAAVTNGGNNLVGDPKFLGAGAFVQGVDDARTFYIIQADSPAAGTASDATNRGAAQTVNLAPTAVNLQNTVTTLPENTSTAGGVKLADIVVTDDALGTNELTLTGANAASFEIRGTELWLKDGVSLNFEGQTSYAVTVVVNDPNVGGSSDATVNFVLTVTDVNEAPSVQLVGTVTQLLESTLSPSPRKMADIVISDDALGTNTLGLSGTDAALFEIVGTELFLKAGTTFDFETKTAYTVNVDVYDTALSASPTGTATLNLQILDVYEPPEVDVSIGATAVPDGGGVSFGSVLAGSVVTRTFTVTNNGVGTLTLQPINITGSDFTVTSGNFTSGQTLAVNASVTFTVTMNTATQGLRTGVLTFANDDQNEGIYDINLSGAVAIAATGTNLIDDGDVGFTLTGTWSNVAGAGYGSDAKAATGTDGNKQTTWAFGGLAAGQYRIEATWLPGSDRASNAPYSFLDGIGGSVVGSIVANQRVAPSGATSAGGRPFAVLGTATVSSGVLVVQLTNLATNGLIIGDAIRIVPLAPPPSTPEIDVLDGAVSVNDGAAFDFGQVVQGASATKTFTVKNIGTADLVLQPISVTGSGFSLASANFTPGQLLAPNATVTMTVAMNTTTVGTFSGGLSFGNNDADEGPFDLTFTGKVNAAGATTFTSHVRDSGFVLAGSWNNVAGYGYSSDAKAASGTNGNNKATWTFSGLIPGEYRVAATWLPGSDRANNAPYVIRDGVAGAVLSSPQVNQRVAPSGGTSDGGRPFSNLGTVTITGNTLVIELSNTATNGVIIADTFRVERITAAPSVPQIEVKDGAATLLDNGTLNFGSATQGGAALTKTVTVKNTGTADLILQPIVVGGTGFSLVSANFTPGQTLAPGASVNITVQLSTATAGTFNGTLSFGHNDGGPFDLSLNGTINVAQPAGVYLIDDGDSGFSVSGSWSNVAGYGYGSDAKAATGSDGTKIATWNFTGLAAGNYRISATWLPGSDRANNAAYTFKDGVNPAGSATVNQKVAPAGGPVVSGGRPFSDIGTVTVTGSTLVIQLTNSTGTNGLIIADAIRIELLPAARPAIPRFVATSQSSTSTGADDSQPTAFSTAAPIIVVSRTAKLFSDEAVPTPKTTAANTLARLLKKPK